MIWDDVPVKVHCRSWKFPHAALRKEEKREKRNPLDGQGGHTPLRDDDTIDGHHASRRGDSPDPLSSASQTRWVRTEGQQLHCNLPVARQDGILWEVDASLRERHLRRSRTAEWFGV